MESCDAGGVIAQIDEGPQCLSYVRLDLFIQDELL